MRPSSTANPFAGQAMIQDPARFAGRRVELDQVLNLLRGMQGVSLVGVPRIGKSSLLHHIFLTGHAQLGEETTIAYTDFRGVTDERSFYECLCKAVGGTGETLSALEDAVREMHEIGLGSVVALRREGCATHPPYAALVVVGPDAIAMVGAVSEVLLRGKA